MLTVCRGARVGRRSERDWLSAFAQCILGMMSDVNPFDGPPTTPPVSFQPPSSPRRRGRTAGVVLATAGLLGAGVLGVSALASADDPKLGSSSTTTGAGDDAGDPTPTTTAPDSSPDEDPTLDVDGPTIRIDDGDGEPFVLDLGDLDSDELRQFHECAGLPMFGGGIFGEFEIFGESGGLDSLDELLGELSEDGELGPKLDEMLQEWSQELDDGSADGPSGDELGPLLDELLGDVLADGELNAWLEQLLEDAQESTDDQTDDPTEPVPNDDELGALLEELLGDLGEFDQNGALAERLEELLGDSELGGWFGGSGPGHFGGELPGPGPLHMGDDGTVTVLGPDGPAWIDLGDGDGSVTITRDGETGELTITTDGTAEEVEIDDLLADLPMLGSEGSLELPDPDQLQDCLEQLDDD
jgi:hypothetical protein